MISESNLTSPLHVMFDGYPSVVVTDLDWTSGLVFGLRRLDPLLQLFLLTTMQSGDEEFGILAYECEEVPDLINWDQKICVPLTIGLMTEDELEGIDIPYVVLLLILRTSEYSSIVVGLVPVSLQLIAEYVRVGEVMKDII